MFFVQKVKVKSQMVCFRWNHLPEQAMGLAEVGGVVLGTHRFCDIFVSCFLRNVNKQKYSCFSGNVSKKEHLATQVTNVSSVLMCSSTWFYIVIEVNLLIRAMSVY